MSELFRSYQQQYITSIANINKKIEAIALQTNHKKEVAFADIKADLTECQKNIKLMETQIASLSPQAKFQYLRKIRQYKKDFDNSRKSLFKAEDNYAVDKNKEMLIGAELDEGEGHKSKFIKQGQLLSDTTYKLKAGVKMMHQTLQIGNNIQGELYDHTGRLIQNKKKMGGIRQDLGKSGRLIRTMMGRIRRNKFILFSVLGIIFLVIIIIMGIYFSRKKQAAT